MVRKLWKQFDTAMVGYWIPTLLTIVSLSVILGCGYFVDKSFYWFIVLFGPLLLAMWASIWSWEHPIVRHGSMKLPYNDNWPLDRRDET